MKTGKKLRKLFWIDIWTLIFGAIFFVGLIVLFIAFADVLLTGLAYGFFGPHLEPKDYGTFKALIVAVVVLLIPLVVVTIMNWVVTFQLREANDKFLAAFLMYMLRVIIAATFLTSWGRIGRTIGDIFNLLAGIFLAGAVRMCVEKANRGLANVIKAYIICYSIFGGITILLDILLFHVDSTGLGTLYLLSILTGIGIYIWFLVLLWKASNVMMKYEEESEYQQMLY